MPSPVASRNNVLPLPIALVFAVTIALSAGALVHSFAAASPQLAAHDFTQVWRASNALLRGEDPYKVIRPFPTDYYPYQELVYPPPAAIVAIPLAGLTVPVVAGTWVAIGTFFFVLAAARTNYVRICAIVSRSMVMSCLLVQWTPLFAAAAAFPPIGALFVCKPTIGLAMFAYRPSWWAVVGAAVLLAASFAVVPGWPAEWIAAATEAGYYVAPVSVWRTGGPLLLLAALRWRRPEGRLLLMLSLAPDNFVTYTQLLLFLVAETWAEAGALTVLSWCAAYIAIHRIPPPGVVTTATLVYYREPVTALMYLPALAMVLRRPNVGSMPPGLRQLHDWLRIQRGLAS